MTAQLQGEYPTLDVQQLDHDALQADTSHHVWSRQLVLRPELYPIQRYNEHQDTTREFSDPIGAVLEAVAPDPATGLWAYVEMITLPAGAWRRWRAQRAVQRLGRPDLP